jgi:chromosome segregation ATPase
MDITPDFIQFYIDKAQAEIAELNKTKIYQSAQVEYLDRELHKLREEVVKLKEEYEVQLKELKTINNKVVDLPKVIEVKDVTADRWIDLKKTE